jgi:hypothetical protein
MMADVRHKDIILSLYYCKETSSPPPVPFATMAKNAHEVKM